MDDVSCFRNEMAERGVEYTLPQAKKALKAALKFQSEMDKKVIEDPEYFDKLRNMSLADKQKICREFAGTGVEMTIKEIEDLISLILYSQN